MRMVEDDVESLCLCRLRDSFNPATGLFDRQLRHGTWGHTHGTESLTSTAIALIGLSRAGTATGWLGLDQEKAREDMIALAEQRRYAGAIGLVIWANCATSGPPVSDLLGRLGLSLDDLPGVMAPFETMEVAWLLSGLAHELSRAPGGATREAFRAIRNALLARFVEPTRIFSHATDHAPALRRARRWVANFADQIYPIQALALASTLDDDGQALEVASRSAERIVALQGGLGQWWWHYDARDGRVAQAYPVYSVHQHGMAPMALLTLAAAGGPQFDDAIELGKHWLTKNELGSSLIDPKVGTIWRSIERDEGWIYLYARRIRSVLGGKIGDTGVPSRVKLNRETRPYEWAWYLFARAVARRRRTEFGLI